MTFLSTKIRIIRCSQRAVFDIHREGTARNDWLVAEGEEMSISDLDGNDTIISSSAYMYGGNGNDMLIG